MKKNDILIDRPQLVLPIAGSVSPVHGLVAVANASLFTTTHFTEPLTNYALGWKDPSDLAAFLEFLAPEVMCGRRFQFAKGINAEAFLSESDDVRAIGADFKRVQYAQDMTDSSTQNKGLTVYVDLDQVENIPDWENRYVAALLQRGDRNDCRRAIAGLIAGATNTAKTWNSESDPDADMMHEIDVGGDAIGFDPNRAVIGRGAWIKRFQAFRAQNNAGAYASSAMTPDDLAALLGIEEIMVASSRYQSAASAKSKMVGNVAIFFNAVSGALPENPSGIKKFTSNCVGGGKVRVYRQEVSAKIVAITVERYNRIIIVDSTGLRMITAS